MTQAENHDENIHAQAVHLKRFKCRTLLLDQSKKLALGRNPI